MKAYLDHHFDMPDKLAALLIRFLEQNQGKLSQRALSKEFSMLNDKEAKTIEFHYQDIIKVLRNLSAPASTAG